jgi:hypothetical protein
VASIFLYIYDLSTLSESLYGVSRDLKNYVRSDDNGITWKAISTNEVNIVYGVSIFKIN